MLSLKSHQDFGLPLSIEYSKYCHMIILPLIKRKRNIMCDYLLQERDSQIQQRTVTHVKYINTNS